jgi:hypothetical protein
MDWKDLLSTAGVWLETHPGIASWAQAIGSFHDCKKWPSSPKRCGPARRRSVLKSVIVLPRGLRHVIGCYSLDPRPRIRAIKVRRYPQQLQVMAFSSHPFDSTSMVVDLKTAPQIGRRSLQYKRPNSLLWSKASSGLSARTKKELARLNDVIEWREKTEWLIQVR